MYSLIWGNYVLLYYKHRYIIFFSITKNCKNFFICLHVCSPLSSFCYILQIFVKRFSKHFSSILHNYIYHSYYTCIYIWACFANLIVIQRHLSSRESWTLHRRRNVVRHVVLEFVGVSRSRVKLCAKGDDGAFRALAHIESGSDYVTPSPSPGPTRYSPRDIERDSSVRNSRPSSYRDFSTFSGGRYASRGMNSPWVYDFFFFSSLRNVFSNNARMSDHFSTRKSYIRCRKTSATRSFDKWLNFFETWCELINFMRAILIYFSLFLCELMRKEDSFLSLEDVIIFKKMYCNLVTNRYWYG